jgi:hypothetical protein
LLFLNAARALRFISAGLKNFRRRNEMQTLNLPQYNPTIRVLTKDEEISWRIAGLFYYSSAAVLWLAAIGFGSWFLFCLLFAPSVAIFILLWGLILGFLGWVWMGIGLILFRCHKKYFKLGLSKADSIAMWTATILFNAIQAFLIGYYFRNSNFFGYLVSDSIFFGAVGSWNIVAAALALLALCFEIKSSRR